MGEVRGKVKQNGDAGGPEPRIAVTHISRLPSAVHHPFGPAARIAGDTAAPNFLMFSSNIAASFFACLSYSAPSFHVLRGCRTSDGTPSTAVGIGKPKIGSGHTIAQRTGTTNDTLTYQLVDAQGTPHFQINAAVSYTHLTLPTNREV